jgi:hypothetical protein
MSRFAKKPSIADVLKMSGQGAPPLHDIEVIEIKGGWAKWEKDQKEEYLARIEALKKVAKRPSELVIARRFRVENVFGEISEGVIYDEINARRERDFEPGNYTRKLVLNVVPEDSSFPVRVLSFDGDSPVRGGDLVVAKMPIYTETQVRPLTPSRGDIETFYLPREPRRREMAIELSILDNKRQIVRVDPAVQYYAYFTR